MSQTSSDSKLHVLSPTPQPQNLFPTCVSLFTNSPLPSTRSITESSLRPSRYKIYRTGRCRNNNSPQDVDITQTIISLPHSP